MFKKIIIITSLTFFSVFSVIIAPFFMLSSTGSAHEEKIKNDQNFSQSVYGFMNPVENVTITNDWAEYSAIKEYATHPAVDLACATGDPLVAADDGVVYQSGYGWDPYGAMTVWYRSQKDPNITILYAHVSKVNVRSGDQIKKGQVIALCGSTGLSTASHLHMQVNYEGKPVNPHKYFGF